MAAVNVDGNLIARGSDSSKARSGEDTTQRVVKEKVIQMQNGCICCTLREDLLTELARLAWSEQGFDHVVIESSGISEPQQVAETFTAELTEAMVDAEGMETEDRETFLQVYVHAFPPTCASLNLRSAKIGGLKSIATVDCMVTVVDAFRFFAEFDTAEFLQDRFGKDDVPEEDQRTISDLFADQLEFANVVIVNKVDMVDRNTLGRVRAYVKTLNPTAKIIEAKYSRVDVKEMLNTGRFDFAEAIASPGWLRSLHEMTVMDVHGKKRVAPKPETLEYVLIHQHHLTTFLTVCRYGIGSFVYRARRPFDPLKLYRALEGKFILLQDEADSDDDEEMSDSDDTDENSSVTAHSDSASSTGTDPAPSDPRTILAAKKACPLFRGVHRSKGIFWLATRPSQMGSWSTAGAMLTLGSEMPWFCTVSQDEWMADEDTMRNIKADFEGEWGDRRQEIVFIGEGMDEGGLRGLLDGCLLSGAEMRRWEGVMGDGELSEEDKEERLRGMWDDGYWAEWIRAEDELDRDGHGHAH